MYLKEGKKKEKKSSIEEKTDKDINNLFTKDDVWMANKHKKIC